MPKRIRPFIQGPLTILSILLTLSCGGGETHRQKSSLELSPSQVQLGTVFIGEIKGFHFFIRNKSRRTVHIDKIFSSCPSCTQFEIEKTSILPAKRANVKVLFDSTDFKGPISKTITIITDKNDKSVLRFQAFLRKFIEISPGSLTLKYPNDFKNKKMVTIKLKNHTSQKITITKTELGSRKAQFLKIIKKPKILDGKSEGVMKLKIKKPAKERRYTIQSVKAHTDFVLHNKRRATFSVYVTVLREDLRKK